MKLKIFLMIFVFCIGFSFAINLNPILDLPNENISISKTIIDSTAYKEFIKIGSIGIDKTINIKNIMNSNAKYVTKDSNFTLDNGIEIKIKDIFFDENVGTEKGAINIFVDLYFNNKKINANVLHFRISSIPEYSDWQNYEVMDFGIGLALPDKKKIETKIINDKLYFKIKFFSPNNMKKINSPLDIYNYCLNHYPEKSCLRYIPYYPRPNEISYENEKIVVIGPDNENTKKYFDNANNCYAILKDELDIDPALPVPIRLLNNITVNVAGATGIQMVSKNLKDENYCDTILLHEMSHYFITPWVINDVFNEGFATYFENKYTPLEETSLLKDNVIFTDNLHLMKNSLYLSLNTSDNYSLFFQYLLKENNEYEYINHFILHTGYATYLEQDPSLPIIYAKMDNNNLKVQFYNYKKINKKLLCINNGYQEKTGWQTENEILYSYFGANSAKGFAYLDNYLITDNYEEMYNTSACFWTEIFDNITIKDLVKEMKKYQKFNSKEFPFFEYLEKNNINVDLLSKKYGFSIKPQKSAYHYIYATKGNVGLY